MSATIHVLRPRNEVPPGHPAGRLRNETKGVDVRDGREMAKWPRRHEARADLARSAESSTVAEMFSYDAWASVRVAAVESGQLAPSRLHELASDDSPIVRRAVAASDRCPLSAAMLLLDDIDEETRVRVMRCQSQRLALPLPVIAEYAREMAGRGRLRQVVVDWGLGDRRKWWETATSDCDDLRAALMALLVKTHVERWASHPSPRVRAAAAHNLVAGAMVRRDLAGDVGATRLWANEAPAQGY